MLIVQHQLEQVRALNDALSRQNQELLRLDAERTDLLTRLREQAERDDLIGIANRRAFRVQLDALAQQSREEDRYFALVLADIDDFKAVNDHYSHAVGDAVLREIVRLLTQVCRDSDVVARYDGEEFALLLPGVPPERAHAVAQRTRAAVEDHDWERLAPGLRFTMSFGVCLDPSLTPEAMLHAADERLYTAKREGRIQVR